ncbi:MAG TPA: glutamate--cysteine ligase, partial [Candidatus Omnitrophota bacterium]|nr:glutamate--cysteine ligase [Candidatus Omnitrophota bacterium]
MANVHFEQRTNFFINLIQARQADIHRWLESNEAAITPTLYSSVDIRDAGFKIAVIDTNIFPAGFNNLCEHGLEDSAKFMGEAIKARVPTGKNILIIAEEHTRNAWYLENIRILQTIIERAGFHAKIATFLDVQPEFCNQAKSVELETATGQSVKIHCFRKILQEYEAGRERIDMIIMNNDLTTGIPDILKNSKVPIYPSIQAGWHSRLKSDHFDHTRNLIDELSGILGIDPWLFTGIYNVVDHADINNADDRQRLADAAADLFARIEEKYHEHRIAEKPFIFLKADAGTYGMGVLPVEDPFDILQLNRKNRNKLHVGKSAKVIDRFLLQEGVPTIYSTAHDVSEVCIYQIENNLIGGFYRSHSLK